MKNPLKDPALCRKWRYGTASTVLTVAVIVAVILLNVVVGILADRYPLNLDLTADDTFTISEECRAVAAAVKADVEVVAFQDESYYSAASLGQDDLNTVARQFYEAMKQCGTASGGKIKTRYINYADNPAQVAKYADYEVSEDSILFVCGERYGVTSLGEMFTYDEQTYMYTGQLAVTESTVEQVIATNLRKVSGDLAPVAVLVGHGEDSYAVKNTETVLTRNAYSVVECDLTKSEEIERDAVTLVIPAPSVDYSNEEIVKIRDWLKQDGEYSRNMVVLTNAKTPCPNLEELINEEYGIEITGEMVSESKNHYTSPYRAYGTVADSEFTSDIADGKVLSFFTRRLILHKANETEHTLYDSPLVTFGNTAKLVNLADTESEEDPTYAADSYPIVGAALAHKQVPSPTTNEDVHSYVAVFGSPYFLDESILAYISSAQNEEVFVSVFNAISGDTESVTISGKSMNTTQLAYSDSAAKWVGIGVFTVLIPVLTLIAGLIVFLRRRHL